MQELVRRLALGRTITKKLATILEAYDITVDARKIKIRETSQRCL